MFFLNQVETKLRSYLEKAQLKINTLTEGKQKLKEKAESKIAE